MNITAVTFTPKRQWKKKRKNRDPHARMMRKRWYKKNKPQLKMKRKKRYKQLSKNPTWQKWQKKLRKEKSKRRMLASEDPPRVFAIEVGESVWVGFLHSLDIEGEVVRACSAKTGQDVCVPLDIFIEYACFANPEDEHEFWAVLESVYGESPCP